METNANGLVCRSVLHAAAGKGLTDVVKLLLDRGADVNGRDCHGFTALHSAMFTPIISEELVKLLIKRGADVNARGKDGSTQLHYGSGSWVASLLMKFGADPNIKNKDGQRPVDISIQNTFGVGNASLIKEYVIHGVHLKTIFDDPDDAEGYFQGDLGWLPPESESSKWIKKVGRARGAFGRF
jgi:ankyrin repeat protein